MTEMMLLTLAVTLGPALGLYFLFGRPLKGLLGVTAVSWGVVRFFWLGAHATEKMAFVGLCWFCFAGLFILVRALRNPKLAPEVPNETGLNPI